MPLKYCNMVDPSGFAQGEKYNLVCRDEAGDPVRVGVVVDSAEYADSDGYHTILRIVEPEVLNQLGETYSAWTDGEFVVHMNVRCGDEPLVLGMHIYYGCTSSDGEDDGFRIETNLRLLAIEALVEVRVVPPPPPGQASVATQTTPANSDTPGR